MKTPFLANFYSHIIMEEYTYKQKFINIMGIPKIEKIIIHSSSNKMIADKKFFSTASLATELISSQKAKSIFSKRPVAAFNLRQNQTIGITISIRKSSSVFNFLEKLIFMVYPNYREFNGWNVIANYGGWNNSFINYFLFTETKSFFQFFDFLSGFDIAIKILRHRSHLQSVRQIHREKKFKIGVWGSFFPIPQQ